MPDNTAVEYPWVQHLGDALDAMTAAEQKLDALAAATALADAEVIRSIALEARVLQRQLKALHRLAQDQDDDQA